MTSSRSAVLIALASGSFEGTARAVPACTVDVVEAVNFGVYDSFNPSPTSGLGRLEFSCVELGAQQVTVTISPGNSAPSFARFALFGSSQLSYNLFLDPSHTLIWGDGITGGTQLAGPFTLLDGERLSLSIYGSIPSGQVVAAGSYGDTLLYTIAF